MRKDGPSEEALKNFFDVIKPAIIRIVDRWDEEEAEKDDDTERLRK